MEIPFDKVFDKRFHKRENIAVVRRCRQHELSVSERVLDRFRHIASRKVENGHFHTLVFKFRFEHIHRFFGVTVNRRIRDDDAVAFHAVRRPYVVKIEIIRNVFKKPRTVQRTNDFDIERRRFFQNRLHLRAVFSDNAEIISSCLARPVFVGVECAELSESVCREQNFVKVVVSHDDFGPMNHGSGDKRQVVFSERQNVAFFHHDLSVLKIRAEIVFHHLERAKGRHDFRVLVFFRKRQNI